MDFQTPKEELYRQVYAVAWLGLIVNFALGIAKLIGGLASGSFALIADAVNSLGDVISSIGILFALWVSSWPPDEEHPYGHTRAETIAGCNIAVTLFLTAIYVGWEAIARLGQEQETLPTWALWIAASNIVIKEALYHYGMSVGRRTRSASMFASAWDHRADALSGTAVLAGMLLVSWGGPRFSIVDELTAMGVVAIIMYSAVSLFFASANELMDAQADGTIVDHIRTKATHVTGVRDVETLLVRKTGLEYLVDIHIEVDPHITVMEGHRIGHHVKDELMAAFPLIRDVLVHLEPCGRGEGTSERQRPIDGSDSIDSSTTNAARSKSPSPD